MIRHRNYYAMVQKGDELEERLTVPGDVMLLYLPLAHNYGRLLHLSAAYIGFTIAFLADPLRAGAELPRVRPTIFPSVPRVYEKIHMAVAEPVRRRSAGPRKRGSPTGRSTSATACRGCARRSSRCRRSSPLQHRLADRLVYPKVKDRLGGRLRLANCRRRAARRARSPSSSTRSTS